MNITVEFTLKPMFHYAVSLFCVGYTDYAGLNIAVILCIASPFSRRIEKDDDGPILA